MKAVNLIPGDAQRNGGSRVGSLPQGPAAILLGALAVVLAFVTVYVLTNNSIADNKATLATDQAQVTVIKAQAAQLSQYSQFAQLAQARITTIGQIATSRFDWQKSLSDLAKVVPANTSLQSLVGTVAPDSALGGGSGGGGASAGTLRGAIAAPAFQLTGCTANQDDVARLMSRLRLMNGVTRVTLADSSKGTGSQAGASVSTTSSQGCGPNSPTFDLVIFFTPLPGATATTAPSTTTTVASTATTSASTTPAATTPAAASSTTSQTFTTSTTQSLSSTPSGGAAR